MVKYYETVTLKYKEPSIKRLADCFLKIHSENIIISLKIKSKNFGVSKFCKQSKKIIVFKE